MEHIYLSQEGYEKLTEELEQLKTTRRRELSKAIAKARAFGDLSENAEYDAAREAQGLNEMRVAELEDKLSRARIIDDEDIPSDIALIGATVTLKDLEFDDEFDYTLVAEEEANYDEGKISISSPVGKALLGHKVGEKVEIQVPARKLKYEILKISR